MSALGKRPGAQQQKQRGKGALAGFTPGTDMATLQAQQQRLQQRIDKKGGNAPKYQKRLNAVNQAMQQQQQPGNPAEGQPPPAPTFEQIGEQVNTGIGNVLQNFGQPFDPGQYQMQFGDMRQKAADTVMNQFNRQMQPQFQQQERDFRQMMAEQGIPENSEAFKQRYQSEVANPQSQARQNAMDQSYLTGAAEQQQGFNQAFQGAQMPMMQLQALSPYYTQQGAMQMQQGQQGWQGQQNQMQMQHELELARRGNKYALQQIAAAPRGGGGGGGGLSYDQQLGLLDRQMYNNMVLQGMRQGQQAPQQSGGSSFGQGLATGATMGALY